ncbi:MAG: hypothetical protein M3211_01715 [Actinomycetota bacterium]|nr:hypothetical protein [Actinomycetota bacterium]
MAATALAVAGLTGLGYAGWALTARRAIFVDIHAMAEGAGEAGKAGPTAVSAAAARSSDALDSGWWWTTLGLVALALLLWLLPRAVRRLRLGPLGFTGACAVAAGLAVVTLGCYVASLTDGEPERADQAALGLSVVGAGFVLVSLGLLAAVVSLFRPNAGQGTLFMGYAGWSSG